MLYIIILGFCQSKSQYNKKYSKHRFFSYFFLHQWRLFLSIIGFLCLIIISTLILAPVYNFEETMIFIVSKLCFYIKNLKYSHLTHRYIFDYIIASYISLLTPQIQMVIEKLVLNAGFEDCLFKNINNHHFCFEKDQKNVIYKV